MAFMTLIFIYRSLFYCFAKKGNEANAVLNLGSKQPKKTLPLASKKITRL